MIIWFQALGVLINKGPIRLLITLLVNNAVFFFCFRFENNIQVVILDYNAFDKSGRYFVLQFIWRQNP